MDDLPEAFITVFAAMPRSEHPNGLVFNPFA